MKEIKPCPFCGGNDIRYSTKVKGHFEVYYHATMYCNKCHTYGPRVISKSVYNGDYGNRRKIENDEELKIKAIDAWNNREEK